VYRLPGIRRRARRWSPGALASSCAQRISSDSDAAQRAGGGLFRCSITHREETKCPSTPTSPRTSATSSSGTSLVEPHADGTERATHWITLASRFEDTTIFFPTLHEPEIWRLINLSGDTHPIHLHLDPFQVLGRRPATVPGSTVRIGAAPDDGVPHMLDDNELGPKGTVRVNPNEVVDIVVRFGVFCGRYMYHCHILEHEDHDMMRPFVVMPAELMPFMDMHEGRDPNV
jgi:FtsP/CotA-like multicopper oxidase with cupredoxin domain